MRILTEAQFQVEAQPLLQTLFQSLDAYGQPFHPGIRQRRIIYEYWYAMEEPFFTAMREGAALLGEQGFYMTILGRPPEEQRRQAYHYYFTFDEHAAYDYAASMLENVIFSEHGSWGLLGSAEHFGLLGGTTRFMDYINTTYGQASEQRTAFIEAWNYNQRQYGSDIAWLPALLNHIG
jgi:hypothetical protein